MLADRRTWITLASGWSLAALAMPAGKAQEEAPAPVWRVPRESVRIDARLDDWQGTPFALHPAPDGGADPALEAGRDVSGVLGDGDLAVEVHLGWSEEGLAAALRWTDDRWDAARIPRAESTWSDPDGQRMDRMYLFDGCKLQLRHGTTRYTTWLAPHDGPDAPLQWSTVRVDGETRDVSGPSARAARSGDTVTLELLVPWRDLSYDPSGETPLSAVLVLVDVDTAAKEELRRLDDSCQVAWVGTLALAP